MRDDEKEFLFLARQRIAAGRPLRFDELAQELGRSLDRVMDLARRHGLAPRYTAEPAAELATEVIGPRFNKRRRT